MKHIANLGITTIEGFSVRNLERFPSMEWGDEGGMRASLYYNDVKIMEVFQEGNGGEAIVYMDKVMSAPTLFKEVQAKALAALKRLDPESYGPHSEYDWLRNKTADRINDEDYEALVLVIEDHYYDVKEAKNIYKKRGYTSTAVLDMGYQKSYLYCDYNTIEEAAAYLKKAHPTIKYKSLKLITKANDNKALAIL